MENTTSKCLWREVSVSQRENEIKRGVYEEPFDQFIKNNCFDCVALSKDDCPKYFNAPKKN